MKKFNNDNKEYSFDSISILTLVIRWRKLLGIITLIAIITSVIASLIIKEKYKSSVILFPGTTNSLSNTLFANNKGGQQNDVMEFGQEEHAEQLLQILHSDMIRDKVIEKFNLMAHYEIDTDSKYPKTELYDEYESNITYRRTEFMAVEIEVLDTDPEKAAEIANYIAQLLNEIKTSIQKERAVEAFRIVDNAYRNKLIFIDGIRDSLKVINKLGVYDVEQQSLALNDAYAKALTSNNRNGAKEIEEKMKLLAEYSSDCIKLSETLIFELAELSELRAQYEKTKIDAEKALPHTFIVNRAVAAEKKSYPVRWLIVAISAVSSFLLALLLVIMLENIRNYSSAS